jgi:hypothetical protein
VVISKIMLHTGNHVVEITPNDVVDYHFSCGESTSTPSTSKIAPWNSGMGPPFSPGRRARWPPGPG